MFTTEQLKQAKIKTIETMAREGLPENMIEDATLAIEDYIDTLLKLGTDGQARLNVTVPIIGTIVDDDELGNRVVLR